VGARRTSGRLPPEADRRGLDAIDRGEIDTYTRAADGAFDHAVTGTERLESVLESDASRVCVPSGDEEPGFAPPVSSRSSRDRLVVPASVLAQRLLLESKPSTPAQEPDGW
jgi:hypothetical protein